MALLTALTNTITAIFLGVVVSYYVLLFWPRPLPKGRIRTASITVAVPAHNEAKHVGAAIESVLSDEFPGTKQILVIDDGSRDQTAAVARQFEGRGVTVISTPHRGKSDALNLALRQATGELFAVVDADSTIAAGSLAALAREVARPKVAAATGVVRVANRRTFAGMWLHMEQLYNSLMRELFSKINANVTTPGPLSLYRTAALREIGGFSTRGFSEDVDVAIRLIRKGYRVGYSGRAVSDTVMPVDPKGFWRQRTRFARGMLNIFRRHLQLNTRIIDVYTLPLLVFNYVQAVIMGGITLYQIISGYLQYYVHWGVFFSKDVLRFFFDWLSIFGFAKWMAGLFTGATPFTAIALIGVVSTLLTYPLYLLAIAKYDRRPSLFTLIPFLFMFPFWLLVMVIYAVFLPDIFRSSQYNRWKKNE